MEKMLNSVGLLIAMGIVYSLLYRNGILIINAKRAVKYVGTMYGRKAEIKLI